MTHDWTLRDEMGPPSPQKRIGTAAPSSHLVDVIDFGGRPTHLRVLYAWLGSLWVSEKKL